MANLALLDVVLPYVFRGENIGPLHAAMSALRVVTFEQATDEFGITLRGHCQVNGRMQLDPATGQLSADASEATPAHDPSRSSPIFDLADTTVDFELFVPREGSAIVQAAESDFNTDNAGVGELFGDWRAAALRDDPATGFVFDFIFNAPKLRPPFLHPAKVSSIGVLEPDRAYTEVALTLPRLKFRVTHGNDNPSELVLALTSAGVSSLDDPGSIEVSEFISMEPPYAYVGGADDRVIGFGFRSATLDLDRDYTPPALAEKTGIGDDWTGLYLPEARLFISPQGLRNLAFECGAQELLIGVGKTGGIWGDFEAALVQQGSGELLLNPRFDGNGTSYRVERHGESGGVIQATAQVPESSTLIIDMSGGRAPYTRKCTINGSAQPDNHTMYDVDLSGGDHTADIEIEVSSTGASDDPVRMRIQVSRLVEQPTLPTPGGTPASDADAQITAQSGDLTFALSQGAGDAVTIRTVPADSQRVWTEGATALGTTAALNTMVAAEQTRTFQVDRPGASGPVIRDFYFHFDSPGSSSRNSSMSSTPAIARTPQLWEGNGSNPISAYRADFEALPNGATITIVGDASYEGDPGKLQYNTKLAFRRAQSARAAIASQFAAKGFNFAVTPDLVDPQAPTAAEQAAWSAAVSWPSHGAPNDRQHWAAHVSFTASTPGRSASVTVHRPAPTPATVPETTPPADPPLPEVSPPPDWFRSVRAKVRIVDSQLIAGQLDLEVDFQTMSEEQLEGNMGDAAGAELPRGQTLSGGTPVGPSNPADGITLFRALAQTDPSTGRVDFMLSAGADPADKDGLFAFGWLPQVNPMPEDKDIALTVLGSYLSFWPLLAAVPPVDAVRDAVEGREGAIESAVLSGAALILPGVVAGLPWFRIERVILFGAEYTQTTRNDAYTGNLLIDVEMDWSMDILGIVKVAREKPLKVRYKAIGIQLTNRDIPPDATDDYIATERWDLLPVFDASRGYTIDIAGGGGGLEIGEPLGQILRIAGARLSKSNPLTLEVDIALGVDLGVVSVDQASVRAYLDGSNPPELTALAASVDIPGALVGSGYMRIGESAGQKVIGGQIDLTIRPVSVRVAAAVEIANITDGARTATGVYIGLNVVLPAGIPLGSTGIGIFGFRGIFGMHYRRAELAHPQTNVPALAWLKHAEGQPHLLKAPGSGPVLWEPAIDNWAFGLGILIGTMEGGVILNLDGTFLLELPGPRVLIMMNARIVSPPPSVGELGMKGGVLAVIEITPDHFMVGILVSWEIEELVKIIIPIEAVFPFGHEAHQWHIYLGARSDYGPSVEVDVLGIVKGTGYLMFRGNGINAFDNGHGQLPAITGFGIGLGVAAGFEWGDKSSGLYLTLGGGMDAVLGFDPFTLAGNIWVAGELRLWIVSIGADASLTVIVSEQPSGDLALYVHGKACGHVDFFFFSVSGCVEITISAPEKQAPIPALVQKVSLQSRSPALVQGTGVDRGIDTSLGEAVATKNYPGDDSQVPVVPIDAIPVISFLLPASPDGNVTIEGLDVPLEAAPGIRSDGYAERSADLYAYKISRLALERVRSNGSVEAVTLAGDNAPATWWTISSTTEDSPAAQLAMLTWQVDPATKALEWTERRTEMITDRWGTVCDPAAPPAEVLWTFKLEAIGTSDSGWDLEGIAWPDPDSSRRSEAPETTLRVSEPWRTGDPQLDALRGVMPAFVLGGVVECARRKPSADRGALLGNLRTNLRTNLGANLRTNLTRTDLTRDLSSLRGRAGAADPEDTPLVVRGGFGVLEPGRGELLDEKDPVRKLILRDPESRSVRISEAFHAKASEAVAGLQDLTATGGAASLDRIHAEQLAGVPLLRDRISASAVGAFHDIVTAVDPKEPGTVNEPPKEKDVPGTRCPVKVLMAPDFDFGRASNFTDKSAFRAMKAAKIADERRKYANVVRLHTPGGFSDLTILVTTPRFSPRTTTPVVARVLDKDFNEIDVVALKPGDIIGAGATLPPRWADLAGPWGTDVDDLVRFAATLHHVPALLQIPEHPAAAYVDVCQPFDQELVWRMLEVGKPPQGLARFTLAAVSMVSGAEVVRSDWDTQKIKEETERLVKATSPDATNTALLKPNSRYRITVEWSTDRKQKSDGKATGTGDGTQYFWFRTDTIAQAPTDETARVFTDRTGTPVEDTPVAVSLDSWLMMSMPEDNELAVFGREPLKIVFNTPDVDRLFAEHGKELRMRLEASNGMHPQDEPDLPFPMPLPLLSGAGGSITLQPATILSPWLSGLQEMQQNGLPDGRPAAPCVEVDEHAESHGVVDVPLPLHPSMGYLLDIEMVDVGAAPEARGPRVFRRHFTTGRYSTLDGLASSVMGVLPTAQFCETGTFSSMLANLGARPTGAQIDEHLRTHGLEPWSVPSEPRVVTFWEQSGGGLPQPGAVLVDAGEPLSRFRQYPTLLEDDSAEETAKRWVLADREWLTVETGGDAGTVAGLVYAPGCQRVVIVLKPGARGTHLTAELVALAMNDLPFLDQSERRASLVDLRFTRAPWEEDA